MTLSNQTLIFESTLCDLFAATVNRTSGGIEVKLRHGPDDPCQVSDEELAGIQGILRSKLISEDTILYDSNSIEIPVGIVGYGPPIRGLESLEKNDTDNGVTYEMGVPSNPYIVFFLNSLATKSSTSSEARLQVRRRLSATHRMHQPEGDTTLFGQLQSRLRYLRTLRITSSKSRSLKELLGRVSSFLFQVSYNTNVPLIEIRFLDQFLRSVRLERVRRTSLEEMEPPRRDYIPDLVYHYQMGLSSDSPPLQFLSFCHVAEHFFEAVYTDDMVRTVTSTLTGPSFSYRKRNDVISLINLIKKRVRTTGERDTYNEEDALRLVIKQYVNIARLKSSLHALDNTILDYYKASAVQFSEAQTCDFEDGDQDRLAKKVASRIYKTRNAIVHSKDVGKGKYVPFHHDRELLREIPLLRFLAEEVIINTSEAM